VFGQIRVLTVKSTSKSLAKPLLNLFLGKDDDSVWF